MLNAFVYIIESPSDMDLLDSRTEGRTLCGALDLAGIKHSYSLVTSKNAFIKAISEKLVEFIQCHNSLPILHFSMHGNDNGISLTDGEFISWEDLRFMLKELMDFMQGGLLICMSSCQGSSAMMMAMNEDSGHPFGVLIGNKTTANWTDAAVAFVTFYHHLFKGTLLDECIKNMCIASGDTNFIMHSGPAIKQHWEDMMEQSRQYALIELLRQKRAS